MYGRTLRTNYGITEIVQALPDIANVTAFLSRVLGELVSFTECGHLGIARSTSVGGSSWRQQPLAIKAIPVSYTHLTLPTIYSV